MTKALFNLLRSQISCVVHRTLHAGPKYHAAWVALVHSLYLLILRFAAFLEIHVSQCPRFEQYFP